MKIFIGAIAVFTLVIADTKSSVGSRNDSIPFSRRKRYVAFPDGSTMIFAYCMTAQTILPFQIFTEGINWGIAYNLPNRSTFETHIRDGPGYVLRRRHRRDLYNKAEIVMDSMGFDGRACIFRALCQASRMPARKGALLEAMIRLLFKFPQQRVLASEPEEHRLYHWAYRRGWENKQQDCAEMFPECSISLIDLALGYYSDYMQEPHYQNSIT